MACICKVFAQMIVASAQASRTGHYDTWRTAKSTCRTWEFLLLFDQQATNGLIDF
jgi:hypothetical protein